MVAPNSTLRTVALIVVALAMCSNCGDVTVPSLTTPTPTPTRGAPAHLELSAVPGSGAAGGTVSVSARVQDVTGATLPQIAVDFTTDVGTFSATPVRTDETGIARTTLSAPAGSAQLRASASGVASPMVAVSVQPLVTPPTGPPSSPPPPPPSNGPSPTGPLTVALSAPAVSVGTATAFFANVQGAPAAEFGWTFGDGATFVGASPSTTHTYAAIGTYATSVTVRDTFGRVTSTSGTAVVNAAPTAPPPSGGPGPQYLVTLAASPASVNTGTATTLTAAVTLLSGATAATTFTFNCGGLGATNPAAGPGNTGSCTYTTAGTATASVTATNGTTTASGVATVTVTAAPVPSYTVTLAASPATITQGGSSTLIASVTQLNGAPAPTLFTWECTSGTASGTSPGNTKVCTYPTPGTLTARVTVTGGSITASATTTVTVNLTAPIGLFVTITASTLTPALGASVMFTATVNSAGTVPAVMDFQWDDTNDGSFEVIHAGVANGDTRTTTYGSVGVKTVKVLVTDQATGRTATGTLAVTVP
jgi:PKD repeat protein